MAEDATTLIRVAIPTKEKLESLKIVRQESFDDVINRILQTKIEEYLEISKEAKQILNTQLNKVNEGKVYNKNELLTRVKQKRGILDNNGLRNSNC